MLQIMKEPVFSNEIKRPSCPAWLPKHAKQKWRQICKSLPPDFFRPSDLPLLESYCLSYSQVRECQSALEAEGLVIEDHNGKSVENPHVGIMNKARSSMANTAVKLRLCPNARHSGNAAHNASPKKTINNTGAGKGNVRKMFAS